MSPVYRKDYIRAEGDFQKRYVVLRTNKAEIRPEEESEKAESFRENLWNEIQSIQAIHTDSTQSNDTSNTLSVDQYNLQI